jgi:aromatic-L-amino-acid/L-tryptophan decarboxylase
MTGHNDLHDTRSSLDPADWNAFRKLAHAALDQAIDFVQLVRERAVWHPVPQPVRAALAQPLPADSLDLESVYREFVSLILPYSVGNIHPRFFGWVHGGGLASGIVAEMMAAALNANCGGRDHAGLYVERTVIDWCKSIFHFPAEATGILVSGTSMANLMALAIARHASCPEGPAHSTPLVAYGSVETHSSVLKAMQILGLASQGWHSIPVNDGFTIDIAALRETIAEDRKAGLRPFCVVGNAGTVNTGAFDDLESLAAICRSEDIWFHVDGAFGALAILAADKRGCLRGVELADSLAFDFHKWLHVQYDAGCLLVRHGEKHRRTFSSRAAYLRPAERGLAGGGEWPCDLGPELSRSFRALKIWFALKEHGTKRFGEAIAMNCRQAQYLVGLLRRCPNLELMNSPMLNIVCFRFRPPDWSEAAVDDLNEEIVADLQESGVAAPSATRIHGRSAIRVCITNHRTCDADLDLLVRAAMEALNRRLSGQCAAVTATGPL